MKTKRYLIGLGNYWRADDGIGLHVVEYISSNGLDRDFHAFETGNDILKILALFEKSLEKVLFIDCAMMGKKPGDYTIFDIDQVETKKKLDGFSTHEGDILQMLELAESLNYYIPPIKILGIEPESTEDRMELSPVLKSKLVEYAEAAIKEILEY